MHELPEVGLPVVPRKPPRSGWKKDWAGRDDLFLGGHLGECMVPNLARPSRNDYNGCCAALS
jgi:hypothetical protein